MKQLSIAMILAVLSFSCAGVHGQSYPDGRPAAALRMEAKDQGVVLKHGDGPGQCDMLGAREALIFEEKGVYHLFYDGAGPKGWLACLATSKDLKTWEKKGPILDFGKPGESDSAAACAPWVYFDGKEWHMFYLGTPNASGAPDLVPIFPYLTLKARSKSLAGPWVKQQDVVPFSCQPNTYYNVTASPGHIVKHGDEYLMFFSAAAQDNRGVLRTLSIARTKDLNGPWAIDPRPIVPPEEQIENSSLYFELSNKTWFLFTNHIGLDGFEYTDAVRVYWTKDLNRWDAKNKAVVLDGKNCTWSKKCLGMPSVVRVGKRLAILYDAPGGDSVSHMERDIGLACLDLPLSPPKQRLDITASITELAAQDSSAPEPRATISNRLPRLDTDGKIVDAHDGCLHKFGDRYYLYGTAYGTTDGFNKNNRYRCYSSEDLATWKYEGELLKDLPDGVYYRPYVIHNKKTGKFVLWYNWYATLWDGQYGVATSDEPKGPFVIQNDNVKVAQGKPGDHGLMVDDDGTAYLIYTSIANNHSISIEKLAPDYLGSTLESSGFLANGSEACSLFKRKNLYYAVFDACCCFCPEGSGAQVYVAEKPLGPYTLRGNINRDDTGRPIIAAQQTFVAQLPTSQGMAYIWMGDRWGSRFDGVKGHDFQYWSRPLEFTADGGILPLQWESNIGDKNFIRPPTQRLSADKIVVESATYGDLASKDPARIRDVKTKVEQALRKGNGRFTVSAMAEGDDPCYGTVKTLKVSYRLNGHAAEFTGTDPETADLLEQE